VLGRAEGRPERAPRTFKVASLGLLAAAVGLFAMPHGLNVGELLAAVGRAELRALGGVLLVAIGLATTAICLAVGRRAAAPTARAG
jgi:uncharacterized membrane protein YidH (DUF202 family)